MSQVFRDDTARLLVEFKDYQGKVIHPDEVSLTIYDELENVTSQISATQVKQDGNKYYYDYVHGMPTNYIFEFRGIYEYSPVLCRQFVKVVFV